MSFIKVLCNKQSIKQKEMSHYYYFTFILTKLELDFNIGIFPFPGFNEFLTTQ